ncbi:long-chain fatty acid--CoA ligase [Ramlibacter sp. G-1-2-2]|uniref:Long-chain fatty acid--CoA ligase n=1 Tax=Ramlibacter agri TaxID=2728837 RepID=A0A848HCF7_9BURK|nr:AMP-binding protein [Ramlibacter agri]NML48746.1 long-chain fatty acid--CoA ligase [Ramlibacter agri]
MSAPRIPNIADQLAMHAVQRPTKTAIVSGTQTVSYRDANERVEHGARALLQAGVQPGDVVGVALKDTPDHLLMLFAVARAGAVVLPMDCRWLPAEKQRVVAHFQPRCVLVEPGDDVADARCVTLDAAWWAAAAQAPAPAAWPDGERGFCLSLSSGTTGRPKGPLLTHAQFMSRFFTHYADLGFGSRETYLNATPLYFGGGRAFSVSTLYVGGTVVLFAPPHTPQSLAEAVARTKATVSFLVPTMLRRLLAAPADVVQPLARLSTLISSGSPLTAEERIQIRERLCPNFIEYYSSTEGGGVTVLSSEDQLAHPTSVGRPVFGVGIEVVNDANQPLPNGEVGRIRYRGPTVADGFYNDAEAAREAFVDGWFYPGDLGMLDDEGYLFLRGRAKDMIIRGGVNIYPLEIETVLLNHPRIAEAAVIGTPSKEFDEEVAAFVKTSGSIDEAEVKAWCKQNLAPYKIPRHVFFVDEFKLNSSGKILKPELAKLLPTLLAKEAA